MTSTPAVNDHSRPLAHSVTVPLTFKVHSGKHRGRILEIQSARCTVGTDPSCALRLLATDVASFHCIIYRNSEGTFVRASRR